MRARDFLERIEKIDSMIRNKLEEMERWRTLAESTTAPINGDRVQSSSDQQKMANAAIECVMIEQELQSQINRLRQARQDIIDVIEQLPTKQYDLMHKVYILGMTFQEIADLQGKTKSGVSNMHRKAIKNVQTILDRRSDGKHIK